MRDPKFSNEIRKFMDVFRSGLVPKTAAQLSRFGVQGSGCSVQGPGSRVQGPGSRVQGPGCRVQVSGCKVQGSGFRVQGAGGLGLVPKIATQLPGSRHKGYDLRLKM